MDDLEEAINHLREALTLRSLHPGRSNSLDNLATAFFTCFNNSHVMSDLEEAIEIHLEALALRPPGHPARFWTLNNHAFAILSRYQELHSKDDLNEAIRYFGEAIELCPPDDADRRDLPVDLDLALSIENLR